MTAPKKLLTFSTPLFNIESELEEYEPSATILNKLPEEFALTLTVLPIKEPPLELLLLGTVTPATVAISFAIFKFAVISF